MCTYLIKGALNKKTDKTFKINYLSLTVRWDDQQNAHKCTPL